MLEIERKYLVKSADFKTKAARKIKISQGYLNSNPDRTIRVRIAGEKGFLTVKGKSDSGGTTRFEWEKELTRAEAEELLILCEPGVIEKIRYEIISGEHIIEVDEFFNENQGLVMAEIELNHPDEEFLKPEWLGAEVTGDVRYYNSQLSKNPFSKWR